ncbi:hypothetical protein EDD15DRAFT_2366870 [Pisolithus albus]|nr:hypothetical protein EDD15DRAFT_2366870 [Pisolithus albus]
MVSSVEDDGSWQETRSTERDTQRTVTRTVTTTREGTTETEVETVVKRCTRTTKTTLRSSQKRNPSVTQSPTAITASTTTVPSSPTASTTTLLSPSSTLPPRKPQSGSRFVASRASAPRTSTSCAAVIPHPSDVRGPTSTPEGYYLVIVGQEVGIFYTWKDTALRVLEISGAIYYKCRTFQQALADYTAAYNKGELRAIPNPGGPFWPTALRTPSPVLSEDEQSYWAEVDDLTDVLSQVQLDHAGNR